MHCHPKATILSEEANPEESSATIKGFNGCSIPSLDVEPSAGVEPTGESDISEIAISNAELLAGTVQELSSLKVAPELQEVDPMV